MFEFLGSQATIIIFMIIGAGIVFIFKSTKKDSMDEDTGNSIIGGCGCLGFIIAIACAILAVCLSSD